jgi:hypothetical protein
MGLTALSVVRLQVSSLANNSVFGGPVVIDFEDLPANGPGTPAAVVVISQYAAKGITFNSPVALDYSKGLLIPGFAHSGTKAIEQCYSEEFCKKPIEMSFTTPQARIKVWVGIRGELKEKRTVALHVFGTGGTEVTGPATTTFDPSSSSQPIAKMLEVNVTSPSIVRATVSFSPGTILMNNLAVDDVEFDTAGPPPPCASTGNPTVTLSKPASGLTVQNNEFILEGTINADAPLEEVMLTVSRPGGTSPPLFFGDLIGRSGTVSLVQSRIGSMLFPGSNAVTVKAKDCFGTGNSSRTVVFNPIPDKTKFVFMGMEITQAIQDMNNSVPLISGKRTVVRVYLRVEGSTSEIRSVTGALGACRPRVEGFPFCGDFLPISTTSTSRNLQSLNTIAVDSFTDITAKRRNINASLNFELPPEWITEGRMHFRLGLYIEGSESFLPCDGCDNSRGTGPGQIPIYYAFENAPPVRLQLVSVPYTITDMSGIQTFTPRQTDFDLLVSWLRRAYPTDRVFSSQVTMSAFTGVPGKDFKAEDVNKKLSAMYSLDTGQGTDDRTRYYGFAIDTSGFLQGLAAGIPAKVASGPTGIPRGKTSWDPDNSYGDWYGGHELGHVYGRKHAGFGDNCDGTPAGADSDYPYANGFISGPDLRHFGFDVGDPNPGTGIPAIPRVVYPPDIWTDVMTYRCNEWISDYTYKGILEGLRDLETLSLYADDSTEAVSSDALLVLGDLNLTKSTAELDPLLRLSTLKLSARPSSSPFRIDLLDSTGRTLASYPFDPKEDTDAQADEDKTAMIAEVVPYVSGTSRIVISKEGKELASRTVTANAPQVTVGYPNGGETLQGQQATVTWQGRDADGDRLSYSLLYSADAGQTWQTIDVRIEESRYAVNLGELPGSDRALFRVIATDGVNTSMDDSNGAFRVPLKAPQARIISPGDRSSFSTIQTIVFVGEAFDREDGNLDGVALQWRSDKQGALGSGRSIAATGLMPGLHTITLEAKDKSGAVGKESIQIEITPIAPVADAGFDQTVSAGSTVQLDGSKSSGVGRLVYQWEIVQKPEGSQAAISDLSAVKPSFVADLPGEYVVQLLIKDATGASAVDRAVITANPATLQVATTATAKQVCSPNFSHELTVTWKVTGGRLPISVTIEITGPDGKAETIQDLPLEGERRFQLNYPGGGSVKIKVTAKDASNSSSSAQSSVQLGKCQ